MRPNPKNPGVEKNLKRFGKEIVGDELIAATSKGGQVRSPQKKEAAKLREWKNKLKRNDLSDDDMSWLLKRVEDSRAMAADMVSYLDKLEVRGEVYDVKTQAIICSLKKEIFKAIHGSKISFQGTMVHIDAEKLQQQNEEIDSHIIDIMGKEK